MDVTDGQDWPDLRRYRDANASVQPVGDEAVRVVFIGNSITESWVSMRPGFFLDNAHIGRGISGQTTPQMLLRFRQDVVDLGPTIVVILAGVNDLAGNTGRSSQKMIMDNIMSMTELAIANDIQVVLCSVLPVYDPSWRFGGNPADRIIALNRQIQSFAFECGVEYVDYHSHMKNDKNGLRDLLTYDGLHPNEAGYQVMEPLVQDAIARILSD